MIVISLFSALPLHASQHCAYTLYEAVLYGVLGGGDEGMLMYVHHVGVLINYVWVLFAGGTHFWGAWLGLTEGTNICLTPLLFTRRVDRMEVRGRCKLPKWIVLCEVPWNSESPVPYRT
jgi:hypothetical protein